MDDREIEECKAEILDLIKKTVNRKYFKEAKLERFFKLLNQIPNPEAFLKENSELYKWVYTDSKFIIQIVVDPEYLLEFSKFYVLYRIDDDPEIFEILIDACTKRVKMFDMD